MLVAPAETRSGPVTWDYEMEIEPTDRRQLVALDLPLAAPADSRLTLDHGLYASRPLAALTRWRMQSAPPLEYQPRLPAQLRQIALDLPAGYNPRTQALARQWRAQAGSNDAAIVQRALAWIRAEFAYTLSTPPAGRHGADEFLFDQKAGFCEHFSSSFVILMRGAGIPARVVTGYAGGYRNPMGDYWIVRRSDAHAWAEVWLRGRGWVRVDPTAAVAPERIYDTLADRAPGAVAARRPRGDDLDVQCRRLAATRLERLHARLQCRAPATAAEALGHRSARSGTAGAAVRHRGRARRCCGCSG